MQVQCYLRHAMSEAISEGIINVLIVTNSSEANAQLTRIHEHIFARKYHPHLSSFKFSLLHDNITGDPTVACVWRRQTFSAAVESCTPDMSISILYEQLPELMKLLNGALPVSGNVSILESAYEFSRMLHGSGSSSADAFYRAFVPEMGSTLYPRQIELVKRCLRSERGEVDRVGATIFPGLVKVTRGSPTPDGFPTENMQVCVMSRARNVCILIHRGLFNFLSQTVVRRAQVICECAMGGSGAAPQQMPMHHEMHGMPEMHGMSPPMHGMPGPMPGMQGMPMQGMPQMPMTPMSGM